MSSVILSTSPPSSSVYIILSEAITPSKLSHLVEKMAKTSRSHPDDGSRSVVSRSERYQILEKKRLIAATPPQIVAKVREKKSTTDDVFSPLSTGTLANSPKPPPGIDWSQIEKVLSPAAEGKETTVEGKKETLIQEKETCLWKKGNDLRRVCGLKRASEIFGIMKKRSNRNEKTPVQNQLASASLRLPPSA